MRINAKHRNGFEWIIPCSTLVDPDVIGFGGSWNQADAGFLVIFIHGSGDNIPLILRYFFLSRAKIANKFVWMGILIVFVFYTVSRIDDVRNDFISPKSTWIDDGIFTSRRHNVALNELRVLFLPRNERIALWFLS